MRFAPLLRLLALSLSLAFASAAGATERVDINRADVAEIDRVLVNIGPAKAAAIVAYRDFHGPFRSVEQLVMVKGIGLRTVEKNRDRIVLGTEGRRPATAPRAAVAPRR